MTNQGNATTVCSLPAWIAFPAANDSVSFINDVLAAGVNAPLGIFAFLSNLLVIITVAKTPSLQRPANVLLCSLASTDCLTGVTTQPLFSVWRLMLYRARHSCYLQIELFELRYVLTTLTLGWSLAILTLISFDRARALSNPLVYRTEVNNKGVLVTSMDKDETPRILMMSIITTVLMTIIKNIKKQQFYNNCRISRALIGLFYCQQADRTRAHNLAIKFVIVKNKLLSVFNASVLLLTINFVITLLK